jgi:hypothetical protein
VVSNLDKAICILRQEGLVIGLYDQEIDHVEGELITLNNLPFMLLHSLADDIVSDVDKKNAFVRAIKQISSNK